MAWYSSWSGWDILWGVLTGGIHSAIKMGLQSAEAQAEAEKAAKEIEKLRSKTKNEVINLPYLRGASNTVATGKTQPYLIGKHLLTPFILNGSSSGAKGYHTISGVFGDNSYYNVILDMGFNRQILNRIFCKDITLKNCTAEEPQEGIIHFPENNVFAGESSFMEVSQDGQPFETADFNVKIVEQEPNELIELHPANASEDGGENDNYKDLYYTLESNSMALDIAIMINGLYHETSNGTRGVGERIIRPYFSLDYARLVAEGDSDPNAHATWRPIYFTRSVIKPAVIKTHKAAYYVNYTTLDSGWSAQPKEAIEGFLFSIRNNPVDPLIPYWHSNGGETPPQNADFYIKLGKCTKSKYAGFYYYKQYFELCWDVEESPEQVLPWTGTLTETQTFSYNMSKQIMFNAHVDFDSVAVDGQNSPIDLTDDILALEYPVTIKITSPDRKPSSGNTNNATYIKFIHSYCYDKALSNAAGEFVPESILENRIAASSTLLGLHIQATKANEDKLDSIQVISSGIAKTWDGETWSVSKSVTSNPASWLLEVLTSAAHPASAMEEESEIDSASFGAWYEYCEEHGLNINYVVTDGTPKLNLIEIILNAGRAETYRNPLTGKLCVAWDRIQNDDSNVPVLSEQNLVSFNWQKDLKRKPDGFKITYINAKEEYREDSIILMYERYRTIDGVQIDLWKYPEKRDSESVIEEITATGITSFAEAFNFGLYTLRCYNLRPKTVSAAAGPYAWNYKPYQKILVQHPSIKKGMGSSEIKNVITDGNNNVTGAELYSPIELPDVSGVHYYCIITVVRNNGIMNVQAEISTRGFTREIDFVTPNVNLSFIESGNLLVYDTSVDTVVSSMILTGSSPSGNNWNLSLVDYNADIFDDSEEIPEYTPHFSAVNTPGPSLPEKVPEFSVTYEKLAEAVEEIKATAMQAYIYADVTSAGFAVGDDNKTTQAQTIRIPCHVIIGNEEREFSFGTITAPSNWTVTIDYHTVIISVPANTEILQGGFNIPIKYREIYEDSILVDENGDAYEDEAHDVYHTLIMGDEIVTYKLPFGYVGVKGGNYKGGYNDVISENHQWVGVCRKEPVVDAQGNPTGETEVVATLRFEDCVIGDYFTWTGEETFNTKTRDNYLRPSRLYKFCGFNAEYIVEEDTDQTHTMNALTDVFEVLDKELEDEHMANNNAVSYLDKLVANDCFVNRIVANEILVRKLVASDAFIDKLASSEILFEKFVASISSKNPQSGDTMIYMGKNPRLSKAISKYQFAISDFIGMYGGLEVWIDKLITKVLATGLLSLNLMGCVQTTDDVYSKQGEIWTESKNFFQDTTASLTYLLRGFNKKTVFIMSDLTSFVTSDFIHSEKNITLKNYAGGIFIDCVSYHGKIIVITTNGVFYSDDFNTWNRLSVITGTFGTVSCSCGFWHNMDALYIKVGSKIFITTDFENWIEKDLSSFYGKVLITDNYIRICTTSSSNMDVINNKFQISTIPNPIITSSYGANSQIGVENNNVIAVSNYGLTIYSEDMSDATEYTYNLGGSLFGQTLFYDGYFYYFATEIIGVDTIAKLKRFNINNPTDIYTYDFEIPFSAGTAYVIYSNGVISACVQSNGVVVYASFNNGISFTRINNIPDIRYQVPVTYDDETGYYILIGSHINSGTADGQRLYTSKGREAGSGITSESLNTNSNYVKFSNGFKIQYGKTTSSGEAVTFPIPFEEIPFTFCSTGSFYNASKTGGTTSTNTNWLAIGV